MAGTDDSLLQRIPTVPKLAASLALTGAVAFAEEPGLLAGLGLFIAILYALSRPVRYQFVSDMRWLAFQSLMVTGIHCLRFDLSEGLSTGTLAAARIDLFFLAAAALVRSVRGSKLMGDLEWLLPYKVSFLIFASLRFVPVFRRELFEITAAQRLRGAKLTLRKLPSPAALADVVNCLLFPVVAQALKSSRDAALSAEAREFGIRPKRTNWDPRDPANGLEALARNQQATNIERF